MCNDLIINLEDDEEIILRECNDNNMVINMDDRLTIVQPTEHSELHGLDYESSGHTGFVPARLSTLPNLDKNTDRLSVMVYVDQNGTDAKISLREMCSLFIRTGNEVPADMQAGEYLFLEKQ